jgi:heme-degrading monooxygenase HmoA
MIARVWQARTTGPQTTEKYHQVFEAEVLENLRGIDGFYGAYLLARQDHRSVHIKTLTLFESLDAIKRFAGDDHEREHVTPAARDAARLRSLRPALRRAYRLPPSLTMPAGPIQINRSSAL